MLPSRHPQDDLLIAVALSRYSYDFEDTEPRNAERAWEMARELSLRHGLDPSEAASNSR